MLRIVEAIVRRPWSAWTLVGGMAGSLAWMGGGALFAALWAVPALFAVDMLRRNRAWIYLLLQEERLALEAARSLLAEKPEGHHGAYQRMAAGAALLRMRRTDQAKEVLRAIDPTVLEETARPGYFLLMGALFARLGDAPGVLGMAEAARVLLDPEGSGPALEASVENLEAVGKMLTGELEAAALQLEQIPLEALAGTTRAVIRNNRAWAELRRGGDPGLALCLARLAVRAAPDEATFHGTLGAAMLEAGEDPQAAWRHLCRALEVARDVAPQERVHLFFFAARAAHQLGDMTGARELAGRIGDVPGTGELLARLALPAPGALRRDP